MARQVPRCCLSAADDWLGRLAQLKVDRASGDAAPHKALLLLVVLELAEQGLLHPDELELTPELAFRCTLDEMAEQFGQNRWIDNKLRGDTEVWGGFGLGFSY